MLKKSVQVGDKKRKLAELVSESDDSDVDDSLLSSKTKVNAIVV